MEGIMAITIKFNEKYVYFGPESGLHTQGEARAETYDITGPRYAQFYNRYKCCLLYTSDAADE